MNDLTVAKKANAMAGMTEPHQSTDKRISIFGLGYVGAVSSACFSDCGFQVIGVDPDSQKIATIRDGRSPIVEPGLDGLLEAGVKNGSICATTNAEQAVLNSDISFVCVGTPSAENGSCDLKYLEMVSEQIGAAIAKKVSFHVVIFRSTVPPGTTRNVMLPIIEEASGKTAGEDFGIGFHPEFLRESTAIADFHQPPKTVIGGDDARTRNTIIELYDGIDENIIETSIEAAEMVKYVDNTWHALKVSFANEVGKICQALSVDSHEVMDIFVQDTKLNISSYYMKPGFAFGGSCLPKDVRGINHLASDLNVRTPVLNSILASNTAQILHATDLILAGNPKRVAFLGVTFKADTDDLRESPVLPIISELISVGIDVQIFDTNLNLDSSIRHHLQHSKCDSVGIDSLMSMMPGLARSTVGEACEDADTIVVAHGSAMFREAIARRTPNQHVVDLVRVFDRKAGWPKMAAAGMDDYLQKPASIAGLEEKISCWTARGRNAGLSILLAEDDPSVAGVIKAKLEKTGHSVRVADTGHEAVRAALSEHFDLVFMDVAMPEMDGMEATSRIRSIGCEQAAIPIIALTAYAAPEQSATYAGVCW